MTEPPDWVARTPSNPAIHNIPATNVPIPQLSQDQLRTMRDKWNEQILQLTTLSVTGQYVPTGTIGSAGDQLNDWSNDVHDTSHTALYNTETMQGFFNTPRVLPPWIGSLSDEVCFDRDSVDGITAPPLGTVVLIPVGMTSDRAIDTLKFGITATTMTNCYVALYDIDETTGTHTKVLDLGDRKADLNTSFAMQQISLVETITVQTGELFAIGVLQVGGTAAPMHRRTISINMSDGRFPKSRGGTWTTTGVSAFPTTITNANVLPGTPFWGAMGTASTPVVPGLLRFSDSFNRPDNIANLGSSWTNRWSTVGISSNRPVGNPFLFTSWGSMATYNARLNSTQQRSGITKFTANDGQAGVVLRGNGFGPSVELNISSFGTVLSWSARIITWSSFDRTTPTTRATFAVFSGAELIGNWTFEAVGNIYTGYLNGVIKVQWIDSGGALTVTSNCTEVGLSAAYVLGGVWFDNWFAEDI